MRAWLCERFGPPSALRLVELPAPVPGPKQVVVSVRVASVNFLDALIIQDKYQYKPGLPFTPGSELAGIITQVGSEVRGFGVGDKVIGLAGVGAFATEAAVDAQRLMPLPAHLSDAELELAGCFGLTYATSWHALKDRARAQAGETLLVLGAGGGVGVAAVELGKLLKMRVIAAASSEGKLAAARAHGADETIDYGRENLRDRIQSLTEGRGVDVIYDPVGGDLSEPAFRSMAWNGRHLVIGFAAGEIPRLPLNLALLKGAALVGVFLGECAKREPEHYALNMRQLFAWLEEGSIRPHISARYPLSRAPEALEAMLAREVIGK